MHVTYLFYNFVGKTCTSWHRCRPGCDRRKRKKGVFVAFSAECATMKKENVAAGVSRQEKKKYICGQETQTRSMVSTPEP